MNEKVIDLLENNGNEFIQHIEIRKTLMKYVSPIINPFYYIHLKIIYDDIVIGEVDFRLEEKTMNKLFNS